MKRFFKWLVVILLIPIVAVVAAILGVYGYYYSIVSGTPRSLPVIAKPGERGAQVNCFSATGGVIYMCGHDSPAATTPFGMARLGPDTESILIKERGINRSGYYYGDNRVIGFSHNRLVGADAKEGGQFRIFPTVESRAETNRRLDRFARFSHRKEKAFPGYYGVWLPKDEVLVELTATPRVGVHRYSFKGRQSPHLLVDITSSIGGRDREEGVVLVSPDTRELEGTVKTFGSFSGRYDGLDVYFLAQFSKPFARYGTWSDTGFKADSTGTAGKHIGVDLAFARGNDTEEIIEVRLALSYVSINNARKNLEAEAAGRSFDDVLFSAKDAWEQRLACIKVEGGSEKQRRIFYTALYHSFQMPTTFNDVNGEYTGFDRAVHKAEGYTYYTDFSLWDTFRTVHPLYSLAARKEQRDMMVSLVEMCKAGGCLPRWPSGCGYTNCMFGTPADVAVSEAYLKGIRDFDIATAYNSMRQVALEGVPAGSRFAGREGLEWYLKYGYCPDDKMGESVAATIEYGVADNALSLLARELKQDKDADIFDAHSHYYRNVWNPATQFFQGKDTQGVFFKNMRPEMLTYTDFKHQYTRAYVEGSAHQWRWDALYDPEGLISLFKSRDYFVNELNAFFEKANKGVGQWYPGAYFWQGNEHDIHAAYLFNEAGRPDLTQKWARWILDTKYSDDYVGIDGNDDGGTTSAWYVLSALGFYPVVGTTKYELGSPLFDKAEVKIADKVLVVLAENNSPKNVYVQRVFLNDAPLEGTSFTHDQIANGGTLRFVMGATPPTR